MRVGDDVSISFSVTFQTEPSQRIIALHQANRQLRRIGLTPAEVGRSPGTDAVKYNALRVVRKLGYIKRRLIPGRAEEPSVGY